MSAKRQPRPRPREIVAAPRVEQGVVGRVLGQQAQSIRQLDKRAGDRQVILVDLIVGDNRMNHRLGRIPDGYTLTPTAADATFAHALASADARQIVITVVGVAQPGARVEVYAAPTRAGRSTNGTSGGIVPE